MTTTRAPWAERKVDAVDWADRDVIKVLSATLGLTADEAHILAQNDEFFALTMRIRAEHRRAVRVVKAARKGVPSEPCEAWKDGYMTACDDILTALQKGRT
mgnify:CR=1 FL=1